jgi:hypothetical protein
LESYRQPAFCACYLYLIFDFHLFFSSVYYTGGINGPLCQRSGVTGLMSVLIHGLSITWGKATESRMVEGVLQFWLQNPWTK